MSKVRTSSSPLPSCSVPSTCLTCVVELHIQTPAKCQPPLWLQILLKSLEISLLYYFLFFLYFSQSTRSTGFKRTPHPILPPSCVALPAVLLEGGVKGLTFTMSTELHKGFVSRSWFSFLFFWSQLLKTKKDKSPSKQTASQAGGALSAGSPLNTEVGHHSQQFSRSRKKQDQRSFRQDSDATRPLLSAQEDWPQCGTFGGFSTPGTRAEKASTRSDLLSWRPCRSVDALIGQEIDVTEQSWGRCCPWKCGHHLDVGDAAHGEMVTWQPSATIQFRRIQSQSEI